MRRALFACCIFLAVFGGLALAEDKSSEGTGTGVEAQRYIPPGAEDGYFSAEDYERLKQNYSKTEKESKTLIQTDRGRILIRERKTDEGARQVQILDTRPGKSSGIIVVPIK